jgi:hypothetical protein
MYAFLWTALALLFWASALGLLAASNRSEILRSCDWKFVVTVLLGFVLADSTKCNGAAVLAAIGAIALIWRNEYRDRLRSVAAVAIPEGTPQETLLRLSADLRIFRSHFLGAYPDDDCPLADDIKERYDQRFMVRMAGALKIMEARGFVDPISTRIHLHPENMGEIGLSATMLTAIASHL